MKCSFLVGVCLAVSVHGMDAGASEFTVEGLALYCDSAAGAVKESLKEVRGVSDLKVEVDARRITLQVDRQAAAGEVVAALAKAGFYGTARFEEKPVPFPSSGVKPGLKQSIVVLSGPYLGCRATVTKLHAAVQSIERVDSVDVDGSARTVRLNGKEIDVTAVVDALNKAGFYAELRTGKSK